MDGKSLDLVQQPFKPVVGLKAAGCALPLGGQRPYRGGQVQVSLETSTRFRTHFLGVGVLLLCCWRQGSRVCAATGRAALRTERDVQVSLRTWVCAATVRAAALPGGPGAGELFRAGVILMQVGYAFQGDEG